MIPFTERKVSFGTLRLKSLRFKNSIAETEFRMYRSPELFIWNLK